MDGGQMLSYIVPTLNEEEHIDSILKSLKPQLDGDDEVIVVDANSTDKTTQIAKKHGAKVLLRPKKGVGVARTEGAKEAKNSILVFIDADCVVPQDFSSRIKDHF